VFSRENIHRFVRLFKTFLCFVRYQFVMFVMLISLKLQLKKAAELNVWNYSINCALKLLRMRNSSAVDWSSNYSLGWVIYVNSKQAVGKFNCRSSVEWVHRSITTAHPTWAKQLKQHFRLFFYSCPSNWT